MADELKIPVSAPGAQQVAEDLKRVAAAEREVGREAKDAGAKAQDGAAGMDRLASSGRQVLAGLGVGMGIGAAVRAIVGAVQEWERHMEGIARLSRQAGQEMTAFALMQEPGQIGGRVREVAALGAGYGVAPGAAWTAVQALQSQTGTYAGGKAAAVEAWKLARTGVPAEAAAGAVSIGAGLGMTPAEAARAVYAAGEASSLSPAEMAQAATMGLPGYRGMGGGPLFGYQVMAGLSTVIKEPGQLGTFASQVALALSTEEGDVGKAWKGLGIERPGEDPMAQLRALQAAGITTEQQLARAGFGEIRQRRGLSILLGNLEGFERTRGQVAARAGEAGLLERVRAGAEAELPEMVYARRIAEAEAATQYEKTFGPKAPQARGADLYSTLLAEELTRAGYGAMIPEGETKAGWLERGLKLPHLKRARERVQERMSEMGYGETGINFFGQVVFRNGGTDNFKGLEDVAGEPVGSGME